MNNKNSTPIRRISFLPHTQAIYHEEFWPFGERLLINTNHLGVLEAAEDAFGKFPKHGEVMANPLVITLLVSDADKKTKTFNRIEPSFYTQGSYFFISLDNDNIAIADITDGTASGFLTPEVVEDRAYLRYTFIEALCYPMLEFSKKFFPIHAACIRKNGVSLILQGRAGSGKSTLAYACIRNGYQLLAEDVVHVKFSDDHLELWGFPWKFHLLPDVIQFFPELTSIRPSLQMNGEWKIELDIEDNYPGSAITNAEPGPILMVMRNPGSPAKIEWIPEEIAIREFEVLWPWEIGWTSSHEEAAKRMLRYGIFRLYTGNDIFESMGLIDEFVEKIAKIKDQDLTYAEQIYPEISRSHSHLTKS